MRKRNMLRRALPALLLAVPAAAAITTTAHAVGAIPVSACGTDITAPGNYELAVSLTCSTTDGIDIHASGVVLDLSGRTIAGPGASVNLSGIRITGNDDVVTNSNNVPISSNQQIQGFANGIFVEGALDTTISMVGVGPDGEGIHIQGATGTTCSICRAIDSTTGVVVDAQSVDTTLYAVTAAGNSGNGIEVHDSTGTLLAGGSYSMNTGDGVLVAGGTTTDTATEIDDATVDSNGGVGIDNQSTVPVASLGQVGLGTTAAGNSVQGNHGIDDIVEAASGCTGDVWLGNTFGSANQGCVH